MSTSDEDDTPTVPPFPDHVVPGDGPPDPVVSTAPRAEPALDDEDATDGLLASEGTPILPVTGTQTGAVLPPPTPR